MSTAHLDTPRLSFVPLSTNGLLKKSLSFYLKPLLQPLSPRLASPETYIALLRLAFRLLELVLQKARTPTKNAQLGHRSWPSNPAGFLTLTERVVL